MVEDKVTNFRLLKSYLGYGPGTVGQYITRADRVVVLVKGSSHPMSAAVFEGGLGSIYELVDAPPTPKNPEPTMDPTDLKPITPTEAAETTEEPTQVVDPKPVAE